MGSLFVAVNCVSAARTFEIMLVRANPVLSPRLVDDFAVAAEFRF